MTTANLDQAEIVAKQVDVSVSDDVSGVAEFTEIAGRLELTGLTLHAHDGAILKGTCLRSSALAGALRRARIQIDAPGLTDVPSLRARSSYADRDEFLAAFSSRYLSLAGHWNPAKILSDETGVPIGTVHRWSAEARRDGFLRRGRDRSTSA